MKFDNSNKLIYNYHCEVRQYGDKFFLSNFIRQAQLLMLYSLYTSLGRANP